MSTAPVVLPAVESLDRRLSIETIEARRTAIKQLMKRVMREGVDYGVVPGTDKPTLFKAGAEKLCALFQLAPRIQVHDLSTPDTIRYQVKVELYSQSGVFVAEGIGAASSAESKYQWRAVVCREEFDITPEDRRRIVYKRKGEGGHYTVLQVRTAPEDADNTVIKMVKKRALVDAILTATAASDIFSQDQDEDEDDEGNPPPAQKPGSGGTQPQQPAAAAQHGVVSEPQAKRFYAIALKEGKHSDDQIKQYLFARFEVQNARHLQSREAYDEACKWAADPKAQMPQQRREREPGDDDEQLEPEEKGIPFKEQF